MTVLMHADQNWSESLARRLVEREFGLGDGVMAAIQAAIPLLEPGRALLADQDFAVLYAALVSVCPGHEALPRCELRARTVALQTDPETALYLSTWIVYRRVMVGARTGDVTPFVAHAGRLARQSVGNAAARLAWLSAELHARLLLRDLKDSTGLSEALGAALAICRDESMVLHETPIVGALALRALLNGDSDGARVELERFWLGDVPLRDYDAALLGVLATWRHILRGEQAAACVEAERAVALAHRSGCPVAVAWASLALVRATGRYHAAGKAAARAAGSDVLVALCRLDRASRFAASRRARRFEALLHRWLSDSGLHRLPFFREAPGRPAHEANGQRCELHIRCLGVFEVERRGKLLDWSRKAPRRPLQLLKLLIAYGEPGLGVAQIADILWGGGEERATAALSITLHRLRKMLDPRAVVLANGRIALDAQIVSVDAWQFERAVAAVATDALTWYRGPFLSADSDGWVLRTRARLSAIHAAAVSNRADVLANEGAIKEALTLLEGGIDVNRASEILYQTALTCCARGGFTAEASMLYERCKLALADELGLRPSRTTEEIYLRAITGR